MASSVALHRSWQGCSARSSCSSGFNPPCRGAPSAYSTPPLCLRRLIAPDLHMRKLNKAASKSSASTSSPLSRPIVTDSPLQSRLTSARSVKPRPFQAPPVWQSRGLPRTPSRQLSFSSQVGAGAQYLSQQTEGTPIHRVRRPTAPGRQAQHCTPKSKTRWRFQAFKQRFSAASHAPERTPFSASPIQTSIGSRTRQRLSVVTAAKWWKRWSRRQDSDLHKDRPAGLPLTMKDIEPLPPEELEARLTCDVEKEACKKPLYSFTGECKRCLGTGLVSFYRKNGKEVISSCITCQGVGYVQRITAREEAAATFDDLDKPKR